MSQQAVEFDRSLLGVKHPGGSFEVTADMIRGFANATGEKDPIYSDEEAARKAGYPTIIAPPTICNLFSSRVTKPDVKMSGGTMGMHAGQALDPLAPVKAGDTLTAETELKDVYTKTGRTGTMLFIVWENTFINQDGVQVARVRDSHMRRA